MLLCLQMCVPGYTIQTKGLMQRQQIHAQTAMFKGSTAFFTAVSWSCNNVEGRWHVLYLCNSIIRALLNFSWAACSVQCHSCPREGFDQHKLIKLPPFGVKLVFARTSSAGACSDSGPNCSLSFSAKNSIYHIDLKEGYILSLKMDLKIKGEVYNILGTCCRNVDS